MLNVFVFIDICELVGVIEILGLLDKLGQFVASDEEKS